MIRNITILVFCLLCLKSPICNRKIQTQKQKIKRAIENIEGMVVGLELKQRNRLTKSDLKQQ